MGGAPLIAGVAPGVAGEEIGSVLCVGMLDTIDAGG